MLWERFVSLAGATAVVAASVGVPLTAAALEPTAMPGVEESRFGEGLSVSVDRGSNDQVVVVAHRMTRGGIRYPWSFQMKAQVGERIVRVTAPAGYDGGEAVYEFPPTTEWVAVRDELSGWKRRVPPPRDPSIRYYPGAYFIRVSPTGIPARWNPCETHTYRVHGPSAKGKNMRLLRATFRYVARTTGLVFTRQTSVGAPASMNVSMTWKGGISYGGPEDSVHVDPDNFDSPEIIQSGMMEMNLSRGMSRHVAKTLLLHELGHALNMNHNPSANSVMHSGATEHSPVTFTSHDRKTLRHLDESQGCLTVQSND